VRFPLRRKPQRASAREAKLRSDFSLQYPRIKAEVWLPIRTILRRHREHGNQTAHRLPGDAFEFRGGVPRNPGWPLLRQRATD
jgi:hypothetical protein